MQSVPEWLKEWVVLRGACVFRLDMPTSVKCTHMMHKECTVANCKLFKSRLYNPTNSSNVKNFGIECRISTVLPLTQGELTYSLKKIDEKSLLATLNSIIDNEKYENVARIDTIYYEQG